MQMKGDDSILRVKGNYSDSKLRKTKSSKASPTSTLRSPTSTLRSPTRALPEPYQYTKESYQYTKEPYHYTKEPYHYTKEPYQYTKEPYQYTKEPYQYTKEPYQYTKEPYQYTKEPYHHTREPYQYTKEPYHYTKEPYHYTKEPYQYTKEPYHYTKEPPTRLFANLASHIDGIKRQFTLRGLVPLSTYKTFMVTVGSGEVNNASDTIEFSTAVPEENYLRVVRNSVYPEEAIIIIILLAIWIVAVVLFFRQWDSIRILQPMEPRYRHSPKNLESIKVVKRPQDSVIYKNYNRKLSVTMVAREKRHLQRMHTAPALPTCSLIMSTLPTIQMEDVMTEM
ncbi:uncharacterized protein LOC132557449 [Ylistrum balloti]|uniref:uncharacterized protein LOC132557449 n=1 Tax=Ylistrum balloti TaxID=509963 RepID=UPI002905CC50|nr:uncharacterized protein LOC132557449 [Ylistrum balloti]